MLPGELWLLAGLLLPSAHTMLPTAFRRTSYAPLLGRAAGQVDTYTFPAGWPYKTEAGHNGMYFSTHAHSSILAPAASMY